MSYIEGDSAFCEAFISKMIRSFVIVPLEDFNDLRSRKASQVSGNSGAESNGAELNVNKIASSHSENKVENIEPKAPSKVPKMTHKEFLIRKFKKMIENRQSDIDTIFPNIADLIDQAITLKKKRISNEDQFYAFLQKNGMLTLVKNKYKLNMHCPSWFRV